MKILEFLGLETEYYQKCMAPLCSRFSLTSMELSIILFLANNPEYDTAKEIVEKRHLTKSHVSTSIRSLHERGFLRKEYRNGDNRTVHLVLLPASDEAVAEGRKVQKQFLSVIRSGFSDDELGNLQEYVSRMHENITNALTAL